MPSFDRTSEFFQVAERLSSSAFSSSSTFNRKTKRNESETSDFSFNSFAAEIGVEMQMTSIKLHELVKLVKQRGLFNDKSAQIQEITYDIRKAITNLNTNIELLERKANEAAANNFQSRAHYTTLIETLKTRLLESTKEFKEILELRTENMKKQNNRRNMYSFSTSSGPPTANTRNAKTFDFQSSESFDAESGGQRNGEMCSVMTQLSRSSYSHSRAEAVENVQRVIGELGQIFQKVASMVTHQEEMVQRIDEDVDHSLHNIREGQNELLNYFHRISSNRTLILKIFAILIAFVIFFVFFLL